MSEFEQGMQEVMENLEKAQLAFDDLSGGTLCCVLWCVPCCVLCAVLWYVLCSCCVPCCALCAVLCVVVCAVSCVLCVALRTQGRRSSSLTTAQVGWGAVCCVLYDACCALLFAVLCAVLRTFRRRSWLRRPLRCGRCD